MANDYLDRELLPGAENCIKYAEVQDGDVVLIIFDNLRIADALILALKESGKKVKIHPFYLGIALRPITMDETLKKAMLEADVVFSVFSARDDENRFRYQIGEFTKEGKRRKIFHMPGVNEDIFRGQGALGLSKEEMDEMFSLTKEIAVVLSMAEKVHIQSGTFRETDLVLGIGDMNSDENVAIVSTGHVPKGAWGNLPSGEAFIVPTSFPPTGRIVIEKAISDVRPTTGFDPITLEVTNGEVHIEKNGEPFKRKLVEFERSARDQGLEPTNVRRICEFGIGTNPKAQASNFLEIEKILGTIHIAIGRNDFFGGKIKAPNHTDMVIGRPTITIDDKFMIMDNGSMRRDVIKNYPKVNHNNFGRVGDISSKDIVKRFQERVKMEDNTLRRLWKDHRGTTFYTFIGDPNTAELTYELWKCFEENKTEEQVDKLIKAFQKRRRSNGEENLVFQILKTLERFRVIKIRRPNVLGDLYA